MKQSKRGAKKKSQGTRLAPSGSLELTYQCNLRCQHCDVNLPPFDQEAKKEELSLEEICRILNEALECGLIDLLLTGGEPLLRPDFKEIYLYCKKSGIVVTLYTNGTLITPSLADFLAEWPPRLVEISLYGATAKTYETVTGVKGSYERCIEGIRHLIERKIPLKLKATVSTLNQQELAQMEELAEDFGCPFRYGTYLNPCLDGNKDPLKLRISPKEVAAIDLARPARMRRLREKYLHYSRPETSASLYTCPAGRSTFNIDPTGKLTVCMLSRKWQYDLRLGNFKEAWVEMIPKVLSQKRDPLPCDDCNIRPLCGNCTTFSELETGKSGGIVPYLCEWAHLLAGAMNIKPNTPVFHESNKPFPFGKG